MVYLDNAATSYPKAPGVASAMADYVEKVGATINRSSYASAQEAGLVTLSLRERLCRLFNHPDPTHAVLTPGATAGLNMVIKGLFRPGDHCLVSSMEHNAVMRPLVQLERRGVSFSRVPCAEDGSLRVEALAGCLTPRTRAVVMTHASNVCGTLLPLGEVGEFCAAHGLRFFVDSAQTAGVWPIHMGDMHIDALAFTGHKGLLGPQGVGGFVLREDLIGQVEPLLSGGTGSLSHTEETPDFLPDRFEAGTLNLPGIFGLRAALDYVERQGIHTLRQRSIARTDQLLRGLARIRDIRVVGRPGTEGRGAVVSVDFLHLDNAQAAYELENRWGIETRCGLHCAPKAHQTLGTYPQGTVRFTPGHATTEEEIDRAVSAIEEIAKEREGFTLHF